MADTNFVGGVTKILADWLNDVNDTVYGVKEGQQPVWGTIPVQNWDTGETVSLSLSDYVVSPDGSALTFTYLSGSLPESGGVEMAATSAGEITGTIDADQGGTYQIVYNATNDSGSASQVLPAIVVGLEITAPVWATSPAVPDYDDQEVGGQFSLNLQDYITDDGDPAAPSVITFAYSSTNGLPSGLLFNINGSITGITDTEAVETTITATATNEAGLSTDESFNITVNAIDPASETPEVIAWESGELGCSAAVVPTWGTSTSFFVNEGQVVSIDMETNFIASDGGDPITDINLGGGSAALPSGLTLDDDGVDGYGIGFIYGTVAANEWMNSPFDLTFVATNGEGNSAESDVFRMTVKQPGSTIPTLDSMSATAGENDIYVSASEALYTTAGTDASYILGHSFAVNGGPRNITAVGGKGTNQLQFTVDGAAFQANNTITNVFDGDVSDLKSQSEDVQVLDTTLPNYVVTSAPTDGWAIERDWNNGTIDTMAVGPDGWDSEAGWSTYTGDQAHSGFQCCKCLLKKDVTVSTYNWGGRVTFPSLLGEGDVMYHEMWLRAPAVADFHFDTVIGYCKFLRYEHYDTATGTHPSAKIIMLRDYNLGLDFRTTRSGLSDLNFGDNNAFKWQVWQKYQVECGIGTVARDSGGNGYQKMWVDGVKQLDLSISTISSSTRKWKMFRFMNTFSPNSSYDHIDGDIWIYVDDLKIYNRRPTGWPT